jgi:hypothetical protein
VLAQADVMELGVAVSPAAAASPPIVPKLDPVVARPVALHPAVALRAAQIVAVASPAALAADDAGSTADEDGLGQRIQADVQRKVNDALKRHGIITVAAANGPISRDLLQRCVGCDFSGRDLHGLDLSNMSLVGDDFDHANLRGVNFSHSALMGLSFQNADLSHANLRAAKLSGDDFDHAMLDGIDLGQASLIGVDLSHASLAGANTTGMHLLGSTLP